MWEDRPVQQSWSLNRRHGDHGGAHERPAGGAGDDHHQAALQAGGGGRRPPHPPHHHPKAGEGRQAVLLTPNPRKAKGEERDSGQAGSKAALPRKDLETHKGKEYENSIEKVKGEDVASNNEKVSNPLKSQLLYIGSIMAIWPFWPWMMATTTWLLWVSSERALKN